MDPAHQVSSALSSTASPAADSLSSVLSSAVEAMQTAAATLQATESTSSSTLGLLARIILRALGVLPGALYWIITFTTITLPTWLFTLFSMSLTFTMNFTTLYDPRKPPLL